MHATCLLLLHARAAPQRVCTPPVMMDDGAIVVAAAGLAAAAGLLQYSLSSGDQGINAFLMREKRDNPFYSADFSAKKPTAPKWLSGIRLPTFDFVEVYGQEKSVRHSSPAAGPQRDDDVAALYRALDAAVEREAYDDAARYKEQIDRLLAARSGDGEAPS